MNTQVKPSADLMRSVSSSFPDQRPDGVLDKMVSRAWIRMLHSYYSKEKSITCYVDFWSGDEKLVIDSFMLRFKDAGFDVEKCVESEGIFKGHNIIKIRW